MWGTVGMWSGFLCELCECKVGSGMKWGYSRTMMSDESERKSGRGWGCLVKRVLK